MKKAFNVELYGHPDISVREVLPDDSEETIKEKNKKQML